MPRRPGPSTGGSLLLIPRAAQAIRDFAEVQVWKAKVSSISFRQGRCAIEGIRNYTGSKTR